jgi:hypothetical protein
MRALRHTDTYHPKATGTCFRDNFGDWICGMADEAVVFGNAAQAPPK